MPRQGSVGLVGWVERTRETHRMPRQGPVGLTSTFDPPYNARQFIVGGPLDGAAL
jgi:hypothetical protein